MSKEAPISDTPGRRTRRSYSAQLKAQLVASYLQPGASVAALAREQGINANVLHRWHREHERGLHVLQSDGVCAEPVQDQAHTCVCIAHACGSSEPLTCGAYIASLSSLNASHASAPADNGQIGKVYEIERQARELNTQERLALRQEHSQPILNALHEWLVLQRQQLPDSSATARAMDYSLRHWTALTRFTTDGQLPVDNNWIENQIRPIAVGRNNWLFAGSLRAGQRAAAVMSLLQSARLNGHDPFAYLKDVLTQLPMHKGQPD